MKRRLFLSGPIGCGKSTLIRAALGDASARAGGFITLRVRGECGDLLGFDLLPASALGGGGDYEGRRFLSFRPGGAERDERVFSEYAPRLLARAETAPFAIIDEFGGYELLQAEFLPSLRRFFSSGVPCVGVLKAPPAGEELRRRMGLGKSYTEAADELRGYLSGDKDTLLLETEGRGDLRTVGALGAWVKEYVGSI